MKSLGHYAPSWIFLSRLYWLLHMFTCSPDAETKASVWTCSSLFLYHTFLWCFYLLSVCHLLRPVSQPRLQSQSLPVPTSLSSEYAHPILADAFLNHPSQDSPLLWAASTSLLQAPQHHSAFSWYLTPFSPLLPVFLFLLHAGLIAFLEEVVHIHTPCPFGVLLSWCESAGP